MRFSPALSLSQLKSTQRAAASLRFYTVSPLTRPNPNLSDSEQQVLNNLKVGNFDFNLSKFNEADLLRALRDDPNLAFSFLGQLKQHGVSLNLNSYATVVRILSSLGLEIKLDSVLLELIGNGERGFSVLDLIAAIGEEADEEKRSLLLTRVSSALVKAYVSLKMFDEAIDVLFQSNRLGCVPDIKACNFLMNRLIEFGETDMVVALFRQLKQLGLSANGYTYTIVIKALCRKGRKCDFEEAARMLGETSRVFAYTTFIEGLCVNQETENALVVVEELIKDKALVGDDDIGTAYSMLVRGFCNEMNIEAAEEVIFEMERIGIGPDVYAFSMIIDRHCKDMNLPKALWFLEQMLRKGLKINCVIVTSILQCYCKMGMFLEALQKFIEFRDMKIFLDRVCYNVAFDALSKLGRVEEAIELLHEMTTEKGMEPDVINYTTLIDGYCLQGKVVDALDLIDEMRRNGISPDVILYNVLANGCAKNGHTGELLEIYKTMKEEGLKPNDITHNVIIEGLCSAREIEAAETFFMNLEEKHPENYASLVKGYCQSGLSKKAFKLTDRLDFPLRRSVYFTLVTSLCNEGYLDKARDVMELMRGYGVEPGRSMYGKLISAWCKLNNAGEAQVLFEIMVRKGLIPDLFTYTTMIHTYCKLNELEKADDLFKDMKQRGIKPDVVTYTVLLDSYLKFDPQGEERKTRKASQVCRELTDAGIELDVVCYTVLIDRQCKIHKLENATKLFDQMIDCGLEPDIVSYTALISGYCREGYIDKSVSLVAELSRKDISSAEHFRDALKRVATLKGKSFQFRE